MSYSITTVTIEYEGDVVLARQRAREIAALLGFDNQDQTRVATAVSELARNAFNYAGRGRVEFDIEGRTMPQL
jgi:anti-sigma regulatory factor (Ser/Thr protein kinase)